MKKAGIFDYNCNWPAAPCYWGEPEFSQGFTEKRSWRIGETYAEVAAAIPEVPRFFSDCYEPRRIGYFPSVIPGAWSISEREPGLVEKPENYIDMYEMT